MRLLIDGYNLLHASDVFGVDDQKGSLRGAREALVDWLGARLLEKERRATVVIFDAKDAPPAVADRFEIHGMAIRFARGYPDADALIEEILETATGTKQLVVVSADHRVQRAARSRGAKPIDSDVWIRELRRRQATRAPDEAKRPVGAAGEWIAAFSDAEELARIEREALAAPTPQPPPRPESEPAGQQPGQPATPAKKRRPRRGEFGPASDKPAFGAGVFDPFPPGYADDLLAEESGEPTAERSDDRQDPNADPAS